MKNAQIPGLFCHLALFPDISRFLSTVTLEAAPINLDPAQAIDKATNLYIEGGEIALENDQIINNRLGRSVRK